MRGNGRAAGGGSFRRLLLALCAAVLALLGVASSAAAIPPGPRDAKVLIVKYAGEANYPYTVAEARAAVFAGADGNASDFLAAVTAGQTSLVEAEPIESVELTMQRPGGCSFDVIDDVTAEAIAESGTTPADFDHVIVAGPSLGCPGSALADIGPPGGVEPPGTSEIYVDRNLTAGGEPNWRLVAHELMHNLGANHAGACAQPAFPNGSCTGDNYGDRFDIMGASTGALAGFPSSWIQARTGIIPETAAPTVTRDGVYELAAANDPSLGGNKLLMLPRSGGPRPFYALETRTRGPFDDFLAPGARLYRGVSVRLAPRLDAGYTTGPANDTFLVDAHPSSDPRNWPLVACERYADPGGGVSIRPLTVAGGIAQVQVALGGRSLPSHPACSGGEPPPGTDPTVHRRKLSIRYRDARKPRRRAFKGRVRSDKRKCVKRVRVKVFKKKRGKDKRVGADRTNRRGRYKVRERRARGRFYAKVNRQEKGKFVCAGAKSKAKRVR